MTPHRPHPLRRIAIIGAGIAGLACARTLRQAGHDVAVFEAEPSPGGRMATVQTAVSVLKKVMDPQGFNIGMNLGKVAGAGIDQHLHIHVVPRWNGDTNFMPVLGGVRVVSEALQNTWKRVKEQWPQ